MYNDPIVVIVIILAVMAGGLIKGTIGFGMPMVALPLIAFAVPVTTAMILLCAPIFLTNFLQIKFKPVSHPKIPSWEMELSTGAVCSNILVAAQSLGYAAQWLTEWYSYNERMIKEVGGKPETDKLAGFIYIGDKEKEPVERRRPKTENVINFLIE